MNDLSPHNLPPWAFTWFVKEQAYAVELPDEVCARSLHAGRGQALPITLSTTFHERSARKSKTGKRLTQGSSESTRFGSGRPEACEELEDIHIGRIDIRGRQRIAGATNKIVCFGCGDKSSGRFMEMCVYKPLASFSYERLRAY